MTADENRSITMFQWTPDPRWMLFMQDTNGDENWHVHRIDLDDPEAAAVDLTPSPVCARTSSNPSACRAGRSCT